MVKYPFAVAAHSYFRILNKEYAKRLFLRSDVDEPVFTYSRIFDVDLLQRRVAEASKENIVDGLTVAYRGALLQDDASIQNVGAFREANAALYGEPNMRYVLPIFNWLESKIADAATRVHFDYILERVNLDKSAEPIVIPDLATFKTYKTYMNRYIWHIEVETPSIASHLRAALRATGLEKSGWRVVERQDSSHGHVVHKLKRVYVGKHYAPRSSQSANRIVMHEIYGHALRGPQPSIAESEGFATVLEQLTGDRFGFVRSFRYLAAAVAWGALGTPKTFRETYQIIWRAMVVAGRYDENDAKRHAFDECVRVFRGGRPDIAGAVFLKDTVYFKSNLDIWAVLQASRLDYNGFIDVLEGRRTLL